MPEESSFEKAEDLQEKVTDILMSIQTWTFTAVCEEWKIDCCDVLKPVDSISKNTRFQRYMCITTRDKPWDRTFRAPYICSKGRPILIALFAVSETIDSHIHIS
jgi:hypothetical protein